MSGDDIRKILLDNKFKLKEIADILSISPQTLDGRLRAKQIRVETLEEIARAINKSLDFFLGYEKPKDTNINNARQLTNFSYAMIPFVPIHAQTGYAKGYGDLDYIERLPTYPVIIDKSFRGKYRVFEAEGDSMDDGGRTAIFDGDKLLGKEIKRDLWISKLNIKNSYFVIVLIDNGITVKKITHHDVLRGVITCHPLNPLFDDFEVSISDMSELYQVDKIVDRNIRI